MKPLFELGVVIHPCTAAVASVAMKVSAVLVITDVLTAIPGEIPELPLTVSSLQGVEALTVSILIEPPAFTWSRNSVKVAFWTCAAVTPAGSCVRSNCTKPMLAELPTVIVVAVPKLLPLPGTY
jgi:chromate transport protein ChrA